MYFSIFPCFHCYITAFLCIQIKTEAEQPIKALLMHAAFFYKKT